MYQNTYKQVLKQFCKFCTRVLFIVAMNLHSAGNDEQM